MRVSLGRFEADRSLCMPQIWESILRDYSLLGILVCFKPMRLHLKSDFTKLISARFKKIVLSDNSCLFPSILRSLGDYSSNMLPAAV